METPTTYLQWGFLVISLPNLMLILGMIVVFVVALLAPFPAEPDDLDDEAAAAGQPGRDTGQQDRSSGQPDRSVGQRNG